MFFARSVKESLNNKTMDWFVKFLFPYIVKDVALLGVTTEEEVIVRAQQLDLVYSQSRVLYDILPNALGQKKMQQNFPLDLMSMALWVQSRLLGC